MSQVVRPTFSRPEIVEWVADVHWPGSSVCIQPSAGGRGLSFRPSRSLGTGILQLAPKTGILTRGTMEVGGQV